MLRMKTCAILLCFVV